MQEEGRGDEEEGGGEEKEEEGKEGGGKSRWRREEGGGRRGQVCPHLLNCSDSCLLGTNSSDLKVTSPSAMKCVWAKE